MTSQPFDTAPQGGPPSQGSSPRVWGSAPGSDAPPGGRTPLGRSFDNGRETGVRRLRHVSNWTLAALIVGVGAASAAFARTVAGGPTVATAPGQAPVTGGVAGGLPAATQGSAPRVTSPVAVTTASGVVIPATGASSSQGGVVTGGSGLPVGSYRGDT